MASGATSSAPGAPRSPPGDNGPAQVSPVRHPDITRMSDRSAKVRTMVVFSNRRLGPAVELLVSPEVGAEILRETAAAARPLAQSRWEHELVVWLEDRSRRPGLDLDVGEVAWSPENFERQRAFVCGAIERAALTSPHAQTMARWAQQIATHPREAIVVGRRWQWLDATANA